MSITSDQLKAILADQQSQFIDLLKNLQIGAANAPANQSQSNDMDLFCKLSAQISDFVYSPDDNRTFDEWYERFGPFLEHEGKHMAEESKVRLIVSKLGTDEYRRYSESIQPITPEKINLSDTLAKLRSIFPEVKSIFIKRFECFLLKCESNQDVLAFGSTVNAMAEKAKLDLTKDQIKSLIFVTGLGDYNTELRHRCIKLLDNNGTFEQLLADCKEVISLRQSTAALSSKQDFHSNSVQLRPQKIQDIQKRKAPIRARSLSIQRQPNNSGRNNYDRMPNHQRQNTVANIPCTRCGGRHWNSDCKFPKTVTCYRCGKWGHISTICPSQKSYTRPIFSKNTNIVECLHITPAPTHGQSSEVDLEPYIEQDVKFGERWLRMVTDTGSKLTILRKATWNKIGCPKLSKTNLRGRSYTGEIFKFLGRGKIKAALRGENELTLDYFVTDKGSLDLLGVGWIRAFEREYNRPVATTLSLNQPVNSIQWTNKAEATPDELKDVLQQQFPNVFADGLGLCTKVQAQLKLKENAQPVFCGSRPVPLGVQKEVDTELDRLIKLGVLKKVDYSRWAAPIVAVRKANGKVRICFDFSTGLNEALEPHHHPLPRPEQLFAKIHGAKYFSKIDFKDAYLQISVDYQSKHLLGVNTHRGLYECQRLAFGIKSAPGIFQWTMDQLSDGMPDVIGYMDDFIVASRTVTEHFSAIFKFFKRIEEFGFKIQMEKCNFLVKQIKFLGQIVTSEGISPDPDRTRALQEMPPPTDIPTLRSFLGAINYYGKYIKNIHQIRAPLDELLKQGVKWEWEEKHQKAFDAAKAILLSDLALTHFDPSLPIIVTADASNRGIGATISHRFADGKEKVFQHAARTLSKTEQAYSQIEKEGLGLIFAIQKFHQFIFGRKFILRTDHRPLLGIFGSKQGIPIFSASRLQRWALILLNYDFTLEFVRTDNTGQADALSRLITEQRSTSAGEDIVIAQMCAEAEAEVEHLFNVQFEQLPLTVDEIQAAQNDDELIREVIKFTQTKWPKQGINPEIKPYFSGRNKLSLVIGCLVFGGRSVIPPSLRMRVLKSLHLAHPGIVRMKSLARTLVYWPSIDADIEAMVRGCSQCQQAAKQPAKQPLQPWPTTSSVFERIHIDLAGPCSDGNVYLVVIDSFSKWPEVFRLRQTSSQAVIDQLQWLFDKFGIPKTIVSDNGPQFASETFKIFCNKNSIKHLFSPPYHPQSNGAAERYVDYFKRQLKKCGMDKDWLKKSLLSYRSTPISVLDNRSPAELFLGRKLRTQLSLMRPETTVPQTACRNAEKMKEQFDRKHSAKPVQFKIGDQVQFVNYQNGKVTWLFGKIVANYGLNCKIRSPQLANRIITRHANAIKLTTAFGTDQSWLERNDETTPDQPLARQQARSPPSHHHTPTSPRDQQDKRQQQKQAEPIEQQQHEQGTPAPRRSERIAKRVRFLSPNRTGQRHDVRQ